MASASLPVPSEKSEPRWKYDVFLSFRGEDTRKNITDHLYFGLKRAELRTFQDDQGLQRGENICSGLLEAIRGSMISLVVFSKNYASSKWCLDELVEIVHCKNTRGHTLVPIFYHVNPSDVRNQTGTFAEAFARHRLQVEKESVQRWRAALAEAVDCSGWDLYSVSNGYESKFIAKIVEDVGRKVADGRAAARKDKASEVLETGKKGASECVAIVEDVDRRVADGRAASEVLDTGKKGASECVAAIGDVLSDDDAFNEFLEQGWFAHAFIPVVIGHLFVLSYRRYAP